ncbi:MAG: Npun_F0494 family protein [Cyanobacteria bacterium P01_H01_bin.58]
MVDSLPASSNVAQVNYPARTWRRAEKAAKCAPFRLQLLETLKTQSVALPDMTDSLGIQNGYTWLPLGELTAENELMWLMAVGLLRREVDGQGLTDSFRLTPLGRQLLDGWQAQGMTELKPTFQDHLYNALNRWLRLPGWLQG